MQSKEGSAILLLYAQKGILLANEQEEITRINLNTESLFGDEQDKLLEACSVTLTSYAHKKSYQLHKKEALIRIIAVSGQRWKSANTPSINHAKN